MHLFMVIAVLIEIVVFSASLTDFSEFRATAVLNNSCSRSSAISVISFRSKVMCAMECFRNVICRRYMVCSKPNRIECSLFTEGENCATLQHDDCSCFMKTNGFYNGTTICPIGLYGNEMKWGFTSYCSAPDWANEDGGLYGYNCSNAIQDCSEGNGYGWNIFEQWVRSYIKPSGSTGVFEVVCEFRYGGFTIFMSRHVMCEDFTFNRNISEYIDGFGEVDGDHWLGLRRIKKILDNRPRNRLSVVLINDEYNETFYDDFAIGTEEDGYPINLGQYEEWSNYRCGDSFTGVVDIDGSRFSAPGTDHTSFNCADNRHGGWWYADDSRCSESSFMSNREGMRWSASKISLEFVSLRIQPRTINAATDP